MHRSLVVAAGVVALAGCDLLSGPAAVPPAELALSPIPVNLEVGATVPTVTATVRDADGRTIDGARVSWTATHGTLSAASGSTDAHGVTTVSWTVGTAAGSQSITAAVDGLEATRTVTVTGGPLARLELVPAEIRFASLGDTLLLTLRGLDQYDNTVATPGVVWTSTNPAVATVQGGRVVSRARGTAVITAATQAVVGSATAVVEQVVVSLEVSPPDTVMALGETLQLATRPVDARGVPVDTLIPVTWESSSPAIASVDPEGRVTAHQVGTAVVIGRGNGVSGEAVVRVSAALRPTITAIAPALLGPGDTATVSGTHFAPSVAGNQVRIAGAPAQVLTASSTELRVALPAAGAMPCGPTGERTVVVVVDGLEARAEHPVAVAARRSLAVGQSMTLFAGATECNEIAGGGSYLLSIFSSSPVAAGQVPFMLRGTLTDGSAEPQAMAALQTVPDPPRRVHRPDPDQVAHRLVLEENLRVARELAARVAPRLRPPPRYRDLAAVAVGETRAFRIPDPTSGNSCAAFRTVTARAVHTGATAVIWEDQAAPLAGHMDARWQEVGQEYEQVMHPILLEYFGDPLTFDAWLANPGRVNMLFSKEVNDFAFPGGGGVLGFVSAGDLFSPSQCAASDEMAIFYARVPTVAGPGYSGNTVASWAREMRSTIVHEVKHIVSMATKMRIAAERAAQPRFEALWLEESTARLAEEFYGRAVMGYGQHGNVTYQESVWCELRVGPTFPTCDPVPLVMFKHFDAIYHFYERVENLSPIGPVGVDWTFYGSGWLLVRWAIDHSGMPEAAFTRALVAEPDLTGVSNLVARAGRPFPEMVADFTLALAVDDHPAGLTTRPELTFPGWDTRDMMRGLNADRPNSYPSPWPLATRVMTFGDFAANVQGVHGGSAVYFQLTGPTGAWQLLELEGPRGGAPSPNLGIAVVRVN
jgi:hypothetical protein